MIKAKKYAIRMMIQGILIVGTLVGLIFWVRYCNARNIERDGPQKSGANYEKFDMNKMTALVDKYFDAITNKDSDKISQVFYEKHLLKTFADFNEATEEELLAVILDEIKDATIEIQNVKILDYAAYRDSYVAPYNEKVKNSTGDENIIEAMYWVKISYEEKYNDAWESTIAEIKTYVVGGEYYLWPTSGEDG